MLRKVWEGIIFPIKKIQLWLNPKKSESYNHADYYAGKLGKKIKK